MYLHKNRWVDGFDFKAAATTAEAAFVREEGPTWNSVSWRVEDFAASCARPVTTVLRGPTHAISLGGWAYEALLAREDLILAYDLETPPKFPSAIVALRDLDGLWFRRPSSGPGFTCYEPLYINRAAQWLARPHTWDRDSWVYQGRARAIVARGAEALADALASALAVSGRAPECAAALEAQRDVEVRDFAATPAPMGASAS
jgi:hypothetical protein